MLQLHYREKTWSYVQDNMYGSSFGVLTVFIHFDPRACGDRVRIKPDLRLAIQSSATG